jgi:hypothetical protein
VLQYNLLKTKIQNVTAHSYLKEEISLIHAESAAARVFENQPDPHTVSRFKREVITNF